MTIIKCDCKKVKKEIYYFKSIITLKIMNIYKCEINSRG